MYLKIDSVSLLILMSFGVAFIRKHFSFAFFCEYRPKSSEDTSFKGCMNSRLFDLGLSLGPGQSRVSGTQIFGSM